MTAIRVHDKHDIEQFLRSNVFLHLYAIGDLGDFFWPYTTWYALEHSGNITALVLLYGAAEVPTLLALADPDGRGYLRELLRSVMGLLPERLHAHLSPGVEDVLETRYDLAPHGEHHKMGLLDKSRVTAIDSSGATVLGPSELEQVLRLYGQAYPSNWFEPRMLETNQYFGVWGTEGLISVAGVHVYSPRYRVAALGNITTHPAFRGKGHATMVTAALCTSLLKEVDHIGLNVKWDNQVAIRCYRKLGFEVVASYGEYDVARRDTSAATS
jgi:RimJ/RimL family protein N-acetyltransferase